MLETRGKKLAHALLVAVVVLFAQGCASTLLLTVKTTEATNDGRSMYMVLRDVNIAAYNADGYEELQELVSNDDPTILQTEVIYPMDVKRLQIPMPTEGLGVYFLFTRVSGKVEWRRYYSVPRWRPIRLEIERNRIKR